jgi:hypothetical protein
MALIGLLAIYFVGADMRLLLGPGCICSRL